MTESARIFCFLRLRESVSNVDVLSGLLIDRQQQKSIPTKYKMVPFKSRTNESKQKQQLRGEKGDKIKGDSTRAIFFFLHLLRLDEPPLSAHSRSIQM